MRRVYLTLTILLAAATLIFILQNREAVTMSFLGFSISATRESQDRALEAPYLDLLDLSYYEPNEVGR
jgi:hypothetical protein